MPENATTPHAVVGLTVEEGVPLLHAWTSHLAERAGIRALLIKGPALAGHGLRARTVSVDVDLLVDPGRYDDLCDAFTTLGWRRLLGEAPTTTRILRGMVGTTLWHSGWPCTIDVHGTYPGLLGDAQAAFDALWARRTVMEIAGAEVVTCDLLGHAVIAGLHALRRPHDRHEKGELAELTAALDRQLDEADRGDLAELAAATGSADSLGPVLDALGAPRTGTTDPAALRAWRRSTTVAGMAGAPWLMSMLAAHPRQWAGIVREATMLTEQEIRYRRDTAPGRRGLAVARARRLLGAVIRMPRALVAVIGVLREERRNRRS